MTILITAGATREPIDAVRFLSNVGTGATGAALARAFLDLGHDVTLLRGEGSVAPCLQPPSTPEALEQEIFSSAQDLRERLRRRLAAGRCAAVIMTAAVADYRPAAALAGKMASAAAALDLKLVRNPKLLPELKSFSPRPLTVVGFKLTVGADETARRAVVAAQFAAGGTDIVVHNDLEEIRRVKAHPFRIYSRQGAAAEPVEGAAALAAALARLLAASPRP